MWEPFGSAPANATASWRGSPNERGTLNILSICIITLLLCAYTSLHLNIPRYGMSGWKHQFWRRALWVMIGLGAPEFVGYIAFREWLFARRLEFDMRRILKHLVPDPKLADTIGDVENGFPPREQIRSEPVIPLAEARPQSASSIDPGIKSDKERSWTRVHSHFALMGGYVFGTKNNTQRDTLSTSGLRKIAANAPELLPDIEKSDIKDKSKANGFAKFLVCLQTCWFIIQTSARLATGLPISLLEMNTVLHAICCILIYLAWWHKPLDIDEPYLLDTSLDHAKKVHAWMIVKDAQTNYYPEYMENPDGGEPISVPYSVRRLQLVYEDDLRSGPRVEWHKTLRTQIAFAKENNKKSGRSEDCVRIQKQGKVTIYPSQTIHGFVLVDTNRHFADIEAQGRYIRLIATHVEHLALAQSLRTGEGSGDAWKFGFGERIFTVEGNMLTYETSVAKSSDESLTEFRRAEWMSPDVVLWIGVWLASSIYGGIHLLAWNGPFPTKSQRLLWRISCLIIASPSALIVLYFALLFVSFLLDTVLVHLCPRVSSTVVYDLWRLVPVPFKESFDWINIYFMPKGVVLCVGTVGLVYAAARTYLIVECFINIAHLPEQVFQEPNWSKYIPHFGAG